MTANSATRKKVSISPSGTCLQEAKTEETLHNAQIAWANSVRPTPRGQRKLTHQAETCVHEAAWRGRVSIYKAESKPDGVEVASQTKSPIIIIIHDHSPLSVLDLLARCGRHLRQAAALRRAVPPPAEGLPATADAPSSAAATGCGSGRRSGGRGRRWRGEAAEVGRGQQVRQQLQSREFGRRRVSLAGTQPVQVLVHEPQRQREFGGADPVVHREVAPTPSKRVQHARTCTPSRER
mmetsp:Transcript_94782/g.306481  ORF Transcript_94782/g.306481 Transcript_94782/m.306481 type:complete len:237 (+) Transcript_94782:347-1057(+)